VFLEIDEGFCYILSQGYYLHNLGFYLQENFEFRLIFAFVFKLSICVDGNNLEPLFTIIKLIFISAPNQSNLLSCFALTNYSLEFADLKLHLQGTDYGNFLANEPSPLAVSVIDDKLREKLVIEFQHMRNHAVEPLSTFLDFIT